MDRFLIHNRTGIKGQEVPVQEETFMDIPEEYHEDLEALQRHATELENSRNELGRLMQVVDHLINVCNTAERNSTEAKRKIIEGMDLEDGNWAVDMENKKIGRVEPTQKPNPRVV